MSYTKDDYAYQFQAEEIALMFHIRLSVTQELR